MSNKILAILLCLSLLMLVACSNSSKYDGSSNSNSTADRDAYLEKPSSLASTEEFPANDYIRNWDYYSNEDYNINQKPTKNEKYLEIDENKSINTDYESMLTLSLKIDTASYTNVQRYISSGYEPPIDAVRIEEMINYFNYDVVIEDKEGPFSVYTEIGQSPFNKEKMLAFMRIKTDNPNRMEYKASHLTFLIDTSSSMSSFDKLPLLQESMIMLTKTLSEDDYVSIVTYAGRSEVVLKAQKATSTGKKDIIRAIENLCAGGSTAGAEGIQTAYSIASDYFIRGGNNRVILATDGDFNVGISNIIDLQEFISSYSDTGIYLSILGFGTGNIREDIMETLSKYGNGNYNYINTLRTANKVLVEELYSNLYVVAKDVKVQIEFNPENIKSFRLIGYENRLLKNKDFADDTKDAGEIGLGSDVVILFEIELNENSNGYKYSSGQSEEKKGRYYNELFELRIRYKEPEAEVSKLITRVSTFDDITTRNTNDYMFAASVAAFGYLLRNSSYYSYLSIDDIIKIANSSTGRDISGYRGEFISLVKDYDRLMYRN